MRASTRRNLHRPRPQATPEIKQRVGHWIARVEAAQKAGLISKSCHLYLLGLLKIPSVARGQWSLYSDKEMAPRLNCSDRTVRRHRKEGVDAGLIESLDGRQRHQTCMVRPILAGSAVFNPTKTASNSASFGPRSRPKVADDLFYTESVETPPQPLPDAEPETSGPALVAPDIDSDASAAAATAEVTFEKFWAVTDQKGAESAARTVWDKLRPADRAAIAAAIQRDGRLKTGESYVANWLKHRRWPTLSVPRSKDEISIPAGFRIFRDTPQGDAWLRYWRKTGQRELAWSPRTGCYIKPLPTEWPPER